MDGATGGERPGADEQGGEYVFRVGFRLVPAHEGVSVDPATFETTLVRAADPPDAEGWFFRDHLWRGAVNDPEHVRALLEESLGVAVESVAFRELRVTPAYREALEAAIAADLEAFRADDVPEVLTKYLGGRFRVVSGDGPGRDAAGEG